MRTVALQFVLLRTISFFSLLISELRHNSYLRDSYVILLLAIMLQVKTRKRHNIMCAKKKKIRNPIS